MTVEVIAEVFPLIATVAILTVVILGVRSLTRRSAGATDAGPIEPEQAPVPGLSATAQDLRSIQHRIDTNPEQIVSSLRELCRSVGIDHSYPQPGAGPAIDVLVRRLEQHLELAPKNFAEPAI